MLQGKPIASSLFKRHRVRRFVVFPMLSVISSLAAVPTTWANDAFTDRCIALNAKLAKLDCRQVFKEAQAVLSDGKPYISHVAHELRSNRARLVALSELLKGTSQAAQTCVVKHAKDAPAVTQAYLSINNLYVKLDGWVSHKWEFPTDFAQKYQRDLLDRYDQTLGAVLSAKEQLEAN